MKTLLWRMPFSRWVVYCQCLAVVAAIGADYPQISEISEFVTRVHKGSPHHVRGVSVAVVLDGKLVHASCAGTRDGREPVEPDTQFMIGSMTKAFTAAGILQLVQRGELELRTPAAQKIEEMFGGVPSPVNIRMLLNHTGGAPEYLAYRSTQWYKEISSAQLMRWLRENVPASTGSPPGEYRYSNGNYLLLGRILERVSGESYRNYMAAHLFRPLKLEHTGYGMPSADAAKGFKNGIPLTSLHPSWAFAAGGLYSTATDVALWCSAFTEGKVLSADLTSLAMKPGAVCTQGALHYGYGFGWKIAGDTVFHDGLIDGFSSFMGIYKKGSSKRCVVILVNDEAANGLDRVCAKIAGLLD